jgi:hypothetical protein
MQGVALVSVMHDPDGQLLAAMRDAFAPLFALHSGNYVVLSQTTGAEVEKAVRHLGATVEREPRPGVGAARRQALSLARGDGHTAFHYCDLDRALHWARHYPEELGAALERIAGCDFLVIGRTHRALAWHPACMIETEALANHAFALAYGRKWDLCAAARGLSASAAEIILDRSRVRGVGTEGEWPALVLQAGNLDVDYVEVEGMEYETPDRFPNAVAAAGGVAAWTAAESLSAANWSRRLGYAWAIAEACLRPGDEDLADIQ